MTRHPLLSYLAALALAVIVVVDGDTIKVDGVSWRLKGFDTPETYFAKCQSEYQAGILAKQELEALIRHGKKVETVTDGREDRYHRVLGRLMIDGRDVAEIMIERGLARRYNGRTKRLGWCPD